MMRTTIRTALTGIALLSGAALVACSDSDDPTKPKVTKTVSISGAVGSGRITTPDSKIDCKITNGAASGPTCSAAFDSGAVVTLTATGDADQEFVAWSGDCSGATCQLNVTRDVTASPRFAALAVSLNLSLATPNADDGAMVFTISGPSINGITPATGVELVESRVTANGTTTSTVLARGTLATGVIGTISVRGLNADGPYTTHVREVAARASGNYAQRTDLSQYRVTVQQ
jgi:hypothetical protein